MQMLSSKVRILPKSQKKIKKNLGVTKIILIFVKQNTIGGLDAPEQVRGLWVLFP